MNQREQHKQRELCGEYILSDECLLTLSTQLDLNGIIPKAYNIALCHVKIDEIKYWESLPSSRKNMVARMCLLAVRVTPHLENGLPLSECCRRM